MLQHGQSCTDYFVYNYITAILSKEQSRSQTVWNAYSPNACGAGLPHNGVECTSMRRDRFPFFLYCAQDQSELRSGRGMPS